MYEETAVISSFLPPYSSFTSYSIHFLISAVCFFTAFCSAFHSFLHSVTRSSHIGARLSFTFSVNIDNKALSLSLKAKLCFLLENPYICLADLPVCKRTDNKISMIWSVCVFKCCDLTNCYILTHLLKSCSICLYLQILCLLSF